MIGSLLYAFTAAIILLAHQVLHGLAPTDATMSTIYSAMAPARPACACLVLAAVIHLWKPRWAGFCSLAGSLLIWSILLSRVQIIAFFYWGVSFLVLAYVLPALFITFLTTLTTVYAGGAAAGAHRLGPSFSWLFPEKPVIQSFAFERFRKAPGTVRMAGLLLCLWLGMVSSVFLAEQWRDLYSSLSTLIFCLTYLGAIFWVITRIVQGRNWARLLLLIYFLLSIRGIVLDIASPGRRGLEYVGWATFLMLSSCLILLFLLPSSRYFKNG